MAAANNKENGSVVEQGDEVMAEAKTTRECTLEEGNTNIAQHNPLVSEPQEIEEGDAMEFYLTENSDYRVVVSKKVFTEMSSVVAGMLECTADSASGKVEVPLCGISEEILQKVIEYCNYRFKHPPPKEEPPTTNPAGKDPKKEDKKIGLNVIDEWDQAFVADLNVAQRMYLVLAANYLDIKPLLELCCKLLANEMMGKTPEEIRKTFGLKNDFTPEEEERVIRESFPSD